MKEVMTGKEKSKVSPEKQYQLDIFTLRLLYDRIIAILDVKANVGFLVEDIELDYVYTHLTMFIKDILGKPSFAKLKAKAPVIYDTLIGNDKDIGEDWELLREDVMQFFALIQHEWILQKSPEFDLAEPLKDTLKQIDRAIVKHKALTKKAQQWVDGQTASLNELSKADTTSTTTKPKPDSVSVHKLQPNHYSSRTGILSLSLDCSVEIAKRGKVKRANRQKYEQCRLLDCLFKTVNSLKSGVNFSTVLGVNSTKIGKKEVKKIRNTVDEINAKIIGKGGPKRLVYIQGNKVFVDKSYL